MSEAYFGEVRIFPYRFAPKNWAFCDGQILAVQTNAALFSVIGTSFGGNGISTFGLPSLKGSIPIGTGAGAGLSPYVIGETGGKTDVTLTQQQLASHSHGLMAISAPGTTSDPSGGTYARALSIQGGSPFGVFYLSANPPDTALNSQALDPAGAAAPVPHTNLMPYLELSFCICLNGVYPSRG